MPRKAKTVPAAPPAARPLPDELTIYTVGELHRQWLDWIATLPADGAVAALAAHAVDQVDAAGLQLLVSLDSALARRGAALTLQDPSSTLVDGCHAMGLGAWLQTRTQAATGAKA
ncbi:STAS domain-containing protein [Rubrivivax albus]|uniref:STAS domain-containing protein n=1 Tax=Rubrivivax albus TaxID=2499835 RepID=A0A3S2VXT7_9BURK|nr:STAS domain-containing protein [Rubrivivax albus]RVT52278.1 STAS domain-containing protein [Rubrivivax albus]